MDKAMSFGRTTILFKFTTGFGLYIETVLPQVRPALAEDPEDGEMYTIFIEYTATAIKLPLMTLEIGRFRPLEADELDVSNIFGAQFTDLFEEIEEDDDDEDSPTMH